VLGRIAARFRLLGDVSRLRILSALMGGDLSVQDLEAATGLSQTNVSRHLGLLRREGVVERKPEGNRAIYRIADVGVAKLCHLVCGSLAERAAGELEALEGALLRRRA
jgi:DNA-binding transcriptional ArsR family regulator